MPDLSDTSPVYAFQKNPTMIDFPGRLAALLFTTGCNFRCGFCHNAVLMGERKPGLPWERLRAACKEFREQWVDGAVISGGEPTLDKNALVTLIDFLKGMGFAVKLDTNGSRPDVLREVLPLLDGVAMDIKCSLDTYPQLAAFEAVHNLQESIDLIKTHIPQHEFRTTVIESIHTDTELAAMRPLVDGAARYVLQPFVPQDDLPDPAFRELPRTSPSAMRRAAAAMDGCAADLVVRGT